MLCANTNTAPIRRVSYYGEVKFTIGWPSIQVVA